MEKQQFIFQYPFGTVLKAFWTKYPHPDLSFVKDNFVLSYDIINGQTLHVKRLVICDIVKCTKFYSIEDIKIYFDQQLLEMKSKVVKSSFIFRSCENAIENITYKQFEGFKTIYEKTILGQDEGFIKKYTNKFSNTFLKGCEIVQENCRKITVEAENF